MTRYAYYNHLEDPPIPVSGWYDTEAFAYDPLPAIEDLLPLTDEQWEARLDGFWAIDVNGLLVVYDPPVVLTWDQELETRLNAGCDLTSADNPDINGLWSLDTYTITQLSTVALHYTAGYGLPGQLSTFTYPNMIEVPVELSGDNVVDVMKALRDMSYELNIQAAVMSNGGTPSWPIQEATIP